MKKQETTKRLCYFKMEQIKHQKATTKEIAWKKKETSVAVFFIHFIMKTKMKLINLLFCCFVYLSLIKTIK